jgi:hypothetical protein
MGDNMSSQGWLRRSNFKETVKETGELESNEEWAIKQDIPVARKAADIILEKEACLYSHIVGGPFLAGNAPSVLRAYPSHQSNVAPLSSVHTSHINFYTK